MQVLTTGFWPTYKVQDIDLPKEMLDSQAQFKVRNSMSILIGRRCICCGCSCPCFTLTMAVICADFFIVRRRVPLNLEIALWVTSALLTPVCPPAGVL